MTKVERRKAQLERHYAALASLAAICGIENPDGKKLSNKLLKLENEAHDLSTDYCNGKITYEEWETESNNYMIEVQKLFNNKLEGLFINGDARGYAIKIDNKYVRPTGIYDTCGLHTDWGGYGILAPEITGN